MASKRPLLWRAIDAAEKTVAPRLEKAARSGRFLDGLGLVTQAQARLRRTVESRSRAAWHVLNLPTASDVARLRRQVAQLDRELHHLTASLERAQREKQESTEEKSDAGESHRRADGRAAPSPRTAGSSSARRTAQRAKSP
jgi:hypothetical protein